jgi:hypothetical protein
MPSNTGVTHAKDDMQILKDVVLMDFIIGGSTGEKSVGGDDFIREMGKMLPPKHHVAHKASKVRAEPRSRCKTAGPTVPAIRLESKGLVKLRKLRSLGNRSRLTVENQLRRIIRTSLAGM